VLGTGTMVVLKLSEITGGVRAGALGWTGVTIGVGSAVVLPAGVVIAPATALEEEGLTAMVELAGAAALEDEGLEAPPPVAGVELAGAAALDDEGLGAPPPVAGVELAGAAALDDEGLGAPPPVAGEPEILPKVRS
jgi:hypothetical protein